MAENWDLNSKQKNCDAHFCQNHAALVHWQSSHHVCISSPGFLFSAWTRFILSNHIFWPLVSCSFLLPNFYFGYSLVLPPHPLMSWNQESTSARMSDLNQIYTFRPLLIHPMCCTPCCITKACKNSSDTVNRIFDHSIKATPLWVIQLVPLCPPFIQFYFFSTDWK